ncbi:CPBP family glutamic-type intramembrane protease [Serratia sp. L9]|uniref:CPBP family glutamic-type intramembrane protease n=1 Tax=Serratia sp. L9 TaxID=3423946 RepID=UPI003D67744B
MAPSIRYSPQRFFALAFGLSWLPWTMAAYLSHLPDKQHLVMAVALAGLLGPALAAVVMLRSSADSRLWQDFRSRIFSLAGITPGRLLLMLGFILLPLLVATWLSVRAGQSSAQFSLSHHFLPMLPLALIAALLEELGWRSYGVDSLRSLWRMLLPVSLAFSLLWALWHLPLFFIDGTYQNQLWQAGGSILPISLSAYSPPPSWPIGFITVANAVSRRPFCSILPW